MFIKKNKIDAEYIKNRIREQAVYYRLKAKEFKALYEEEEEPIVKEQLEKLWFEYRDIEIRFTRMYWDFYMNKINDL